MASVFLIELTDTCSFAFTGTASISDEFILTLLGGILGKQRMKLWRADLRNGDEMRLSDII